MGPTPVACAQQSLPLVTARCSPTGSTSQASMGRPDCSDTHCCLPLLLLLLLLLAALARQPQTTLRQWALRVGAGSVGLRLALAQGIATQLHGTPWTWQQPVRLLVTEICLLEAARCPPPVESAPPPVAHPPLHHWPRRPHSPGDIGGCAGRGARIGTAHVQTSGTARCSPDREHAQHSHGRVGTGASARNRARHRAGQAARNQPQGAASGPISPSGQ